MRRTRVVPVLLLKERGLVKTIRFKEPKYVGDPINAVRIFNEKEVDEIVIFDIFARRYNRSPDIEFIKEFASECFMPLCYGGGVQNIQQMESIFKAGVEKISLNSSAYKSMELVSQGAREFGSQSIVVSIDVKKTFFGKYRVAFAKGNKLCISGVDPMSYVQEAVDKGAGEILINSVDRDGTGAGYDLYLVSEISRLVDVPVVACGGAGKLSDFTDAVKAGASAVAAGQYFVFQGKYRAVLISYPDADSLNKLLP
jgi:cyclase